MEATRLVPVLGVGECQVWWAGPGDARPGHDAVLPPDERERRERLRRSADRDRFTAGYALARLVLAAHLGAEPDALVFDRVCRHCGGAHGKPGLVPPHDGLRFSLSHSGDRVAVAVLRADGGGAAGTRPADVGVDVEESTRNVELDALAGSVLSREEAAVLAGLAPAARVPAFFTYWTRKEAVLKATGHGLRVPMTRLTVSAPGAPPELLSWAGHRNLPARAQLRDLHAGPGHTAAVCVVDSAPVTVVEINGAAVLKAFV